MFRAAKIILYLIAIAYPWYEFRVEGVPIVSYEGIGSMAFPAVVLLLQFFPRRKTSSVKTVVSELLTSAVLATLAQFVYLGIQGYFGQPDEMKSMIRLDWIVLPFVLVFLWLLNRRRPS